MKRYGITASAKADLHEIWAFIAADAPDAADRWIARLFDAFELLARNPDVGHRRDDLTRRPVRFWSVDRYVIIYRPERRPIEIIAVTQGGRVNPRFLRSRL